MIETEIFPALFNYGMAGIFIIYLIYERQQARKVWTEALSKITHTVERNTDAIQSLMQMFNRR